LNNIGNILTESGHPEQSISYHTKALAIQTAIDDSTGIFTSDLSLAQTYNSIKKYALAEKHGEQALAILNKSGGIVNMYVDAYELMAQVYKNNKSYQKAIGAYELHTLYKDSLIKESNNQIVADLQEKYESDKKDIAIKKKQLELNNAQFKITQRNIIALSLVATIILILILGYLLYNRYKLKKLQELNEEIIKQQSIRSKAVIDAEEKERTRIAKDLHDGLGQQLSAVKLLTQSIQTTAADSERSEKMNALLKMLDDSVKEVRSVSHNMMPNALLKSGLIAAVREFIDKIVSTGLLKIDLQIVGLTNRLDTTIETVLYRVLQELVNNIIKHANANKISIQIIKHDDNNLNLVMEDDGRGFDTTNIDSFNGIGLKNIISRVEYLNGSVDFDSQPGKGTTVIIDIPLS
jgi:signal transduction histidine kinase